MRRRRGVPGQLLARAPRARARGRERRRRRRELVDRGGERRRRRPAGRRGRRRTRDGLARGRRRRRRPRARRRRAPAGARRSGRARAGTGRRRRSLRRARGRSPPPERTRRRRPRRAARSGRADRLARVFELLVGPDEAERARAAVVGAWRVARKTGWGITRSFSSTPKRRERLAAALAVDDDSLEAPEGAAPELGLRRRPARQQVVGGEDRRCAVPEQPQSSSGAASHWTWRTSAGVAARRARPSGCSSAFSGSAQPRAAEEPRRERVEELAAAVALRLGRVAEAEPRRDELDVDTLPVRARGELVVVRRREGRRVGEDDAHADEARTCLLVRSWNVFHGNTCRRGARHLAAMSGSPRRPAGRPLPAGGAALGADAARRVERDDGCARRDRGRRSRTLARPATHAARPGRLRSALAGQANAILLRAGARAARARTLRLERAGARAARVCHAVRLAGSSSPTCTPERVPPGRGAARGDLRAALRRAVAAAGSCVLAGDFNLARVLPELVAAGPGIDHVLVRGRAGPLRSGRTSGACRRPALRSRARRGAVG